MSVLRGIEQNLLDIKKQLQTIAVSGKPNNRDGKPPYELTKVVAELNLPVAVREHYEAKYSHPWRSRLKGFMKFGLEFGAIGVALWLAFLNRGVLTEIQKQTPKIAKSADAAKSAADTASKSLEVSERPWLSIEDVSIGSPLTFNNGGGLVSINYSIKNYGNSPAAHVNWRTKLLPLTMTKDILAEILLQQSALCDPLRKVQTSTPDTLVFPGQIHPEGEVAGAYAPDIQAAMRARETGRFRHTGFASFALIVCVDYQLSFVATHHQSTYSAMLGIGTPPKPTVFLGALAQPPFMTDIQPQGTVSNLGLFVIRNTAN